MDQFEVPLETLLESILSVADLIFCLDQEGRFLNVRTNEQILLAWPPDKFLGRTLEEVLEPELARLTRYYLNKAFLEGKRQSFEYQMEVGGERRDFEAILMAVTEKRCMAFIRDITPRKAAERELQKNQAFLQNIFDGLRDGLSILDRELNILKVNYWMQKKYAHALPLEGRKCYEVYQHRQSVCP